jgi:nitric oxide reductase activation protein
MIPYQDKAGKHSNLEQLAFADARQENLDGFAIRYIANRMVANNPISKDSTHALFVLTDGVPYGRGYEPKVSVAHTRGCVQKVIDSGIDFLAIGIEDAFDEDQGKAIYGKDNFVLLQDVSSSLQILIRQIKKLFE